MKNIYRKLVDQFINIRIPIGKPNVKSNPSLKRSTYAQQAEKLLLNEFKAIYVLIPKTGCTSIKKFFSNHYGWNEVENVHNTSSEIYDHIFYEDLRQKKYQGYFKFTFARNPFSRIYSAYTSKVRPQGVKNPKWVDGVEFGLYKMGVRKEHSFDEFVELVCNTPDHLCDAHVKSQWQFITAEDGTLLADKIYRFEYFQKDFIELLKRLNIDANPQKIPHVNRTQVEPNQFISHFNSRLVKIVAKRYKKDFELLNYPAFL